MELILPTDDAPKSYFMCTESEEDLLSWLEALSEHTGDVVPSSPAREPSSPAVSSAFSSSSAGGGSSALAPSAAAVNSPSRATTVDQSYRCVNALGGNETFDTAIYGPAEVMDENARIVLSRVWPLPSVLLLLLLLSLLLSVGCG